MSLSDSSYATHLASGATTTCLCWRIARSDGVIVGVTDHDRMLSSGGIEYSPGAAVDGAEFSSDVGFAPGTGAMRGALSSDLITESDLAAGLWVGAEVSVYRVNWMSPEQKLHVWSGRLSEVSFNGETFEAELVSQKADLERLVGRAYTRRCDATFGDARCGVDADDPDYTGQTCDQTFETCRAQFQNAKNFRGFPHIPGTDFVLAGPAATGNDGGKR